jgi:hypothetical protein
MIKGAEMRVYQPKQRPIEHGFKQGDYHLVANASTKTIKAFDFAGKELWEKPCLADGQHPNWRIGQGDTPPGLYKLGTAYRDYDRFIDDPGYPPFCRELRSFGWVSFDMVDLEGHEDDNGRSGIMLHGGGTACGWPGAWERYQALYPTWGCLRMHNADLQFEVLPLYDKGTVYLSVWQDSV